MRKRSFSTDYAGRLTRRPSISIAAWGVNAMSSNEHSVLTFTSRTVLAKFIDPSGQLVERPIEIRANPITGRTCRIAFSRTKEKEAGTDALPLPPPDAEDTANCPFCRPQVASLTPQLNPDLAGEDCPAKIRCYFPICFPMAVIPRSA